MLRTVTVCGALVTFNGELNVRAFVDSVRVGPVVMYVNPLVSVALWPPGFVTTTFTAPAA